MQHVHRISVRDAVCGFDPPRGSIGENKGAIPDGEPLEASAVSGEMVVSKLPQKDCPGP